jgi:hypothetical protein
MLKASIAEKHEIVATISRYGGIGLGRLVEGTVYRSGGNGFYYPAPELAYRRDGGEGYRRALRGLALPPAYRRDTP